VYKKGEGYYLFLKKNGKWAVGPDVINEDLWYLESGGIAMTPDAVVNHKYDTYWSYRRSMGSSRSYSSYSIYAVRAKYSEDHMPQIVELAAPEQSEAYKIRKKYFGVYRRIDQAARNAPVWRLVTDARYTYIYLVRTKDGRWVIQDGTLRKKRLPLYTHCGYARSAMGKQVVGIQT